MEKIFSGVLFDLINKGYDMKTEFPSGKRTSPL